MNIFATSVNLRLHAAEQIGRVSHIARNRPPEKDFAWGRKSSRIYRQGFEFLIGSTDPPGFRVGLNFSSVSKTLRKGSIKR